MDFLTMTGNSGLSCWAEAITGVEADSINSDAEKSWETVLRDLGGVNAERKEERGERSVRGT